MMAVGVKKRGGDGVVKYLRVNLTIFGIQPDSSQFSQSDLLKLLI